MRAHGFTVDMFAKIVLGGLATVTTGRGVTGRKTIEVTRVRITDHDARHPKWDAG